jgi:pyruvate/2-oxoglutarate dehydrogenase complex dihydrolipoamide dehydrogenase (E3) component
MALDHGAAVHAVQPRTHAATRIGDDGVGTRFHLCHVDADVAFEQHAEVGGAPGIWALGDCNGRGAFTHTAYNDFEIVAANLLDGEHRKLGERVSGYALYIDPPLGRVGMSEAEARKRGRPYLVGKRAMARVGRAVEKDETRGFMKVVIDADSKAILGAAILGAEGDEAIHGIIDMMSVGANATQLQRTVPIHPTVSELIPTLISEARPPDD